MPECRYNKGQIFQLVLPFQSNVLCDGKIISIHRVKTFIFYEILMTLGNFQKYKCCVFYCWACFTTLRGIFLGWLSVICCTMWSGSLWYLANTSRLNTSNFLRLELFCFSLHEGRPLRLCSPQWHVNTGDNTWNW